MIGQRFQGTEPIRCPLVSFFFAAGCGGADRLTVAPGLGGAAEQVQLVVQLGTQVGVVSGVQGVAAGQVKGEHSGQQQPVKRKAGYCPQNHTHLGAGESIAETKDGRLP